jgi:hypothetical protein
MIPVSSKFLNVSSYGFDSVNACLTEPTLLMPVWVVSFNGEWAWFGGSYQGFPIDESIYNLVRDPAATVLADGTVNVGGVVVNGVAVGGTNYEIVQNIAGLIETKAVDP